MTNILFSLAEYDMKESCTVYVLIYARDVQKGDNHTYCYAFSFEHHLLHLVYSM